MKSPILAQILIAFLLSAVLAAPAQADRGQSRRNLARAARDLRDSNTAQRKLEKDLKTLTPTQQSQLLSSQAASAAEDSDGDSVPDAIEHAQGTDACKPSSGGDHSDSQEREAHGKISAVADGSFTLGNDSWSFDSQTLFEDGTVESIVIGACVEVHGFLDTSSVLHATQVEFKTGDDCHR